MSLEAIRYQRGSLTILDQLLLPHQSIYVPILTSADAFDAIKRMVVRGAPAIAIVAALALAVELYHSTELRARDNRDEIRAFIGQRLDYLNLSRPTAVNLSDAVRKLKASVAVGTAGATGADVVETYLAAAEKMLVDDVQDNRNIGDNGARWIAENAGGEDGKVKVLTHCNTGYGLQLMTGGGGEADRKDRSLATAGYGTALGIIRSLHANSALAHAYCTETRPYNQGSRLTAYELATDLPAGMSTLITDSMASALLRQDKIAAIVVGADRVAANGDTANKIGTYQLAIVAKYHGVKFVVAAPTTSVDMNTASGKDIVIEQRPENEVLCVKGPVVKDAATMELDLGEMRTIAPGVASGINVFNPSFDVTPRELIDAIVTEKGVAVKNDKGEFDLGVFF